MSSRTIGRIFVFAALVGVALPTVVNGQGSIVFQTFVSLLAATTLHLLLHEAGHARAALAVGLRVDSIVIGGGPRLLRVPIGEAVFDVRALPVGGLVIPALPGADVEFDGARRRFALVWCAGPLVTALVTFFGPDVVRWLAVMGDGQPSPLSVRFARDVYFVGLLVLVESALPLRRDNDCRVVLELLTGSKATIEDRVGFVAANRILRRGQEGDVDGALRLPEASASTPHIRYAVAAALMMGERHNEAVDVLRPLACEELSDKLRVAVWIDLAFCAAYSGDTNAALPAEIYTRQLCDTLPKRHPHRSGAIIGRGYVLATLDRHEEALGLFDGALKRELPADLGAEALAGRSLARLGMGDFDGARCDVEQARRTKASASGVLLAEHTMGRSPELLGQDSRSQSLR